jgi:hypothetical protein
MTSKTFIRLMLVLSIITVGMLLMANSGKTVCQQAKECPAKQEKQDNIQASGGLMIWESVSQHLLSAVQ